MKARKLLSESGEKEIRGMEMGGEGASWGGVMARQGGGGIYASAIAGIMMDDADDTSGSANCSVSERAWGEN